MLVCLDDESVARDEAAAYLPDDCVGAGGERNGPSEIAGIDNAPPFVSGHHRFRHERGAVRSDHPRPCPVGFVGCAELVSKSEFNDLAWPDRTGHSPRRRNLPGSVDRRVRSVNTGCSSRVELRPTRLRLSIAQRRFGWLQRSRGRGWRRCGGGLRLCGAGRGRRVRGSRRSFLTCSSAGRSEHQKRRSEDLYDCAPHVASSYP